MGKGTGPHGEPVCPAVEVIGLKAQPIALLTPGSVHVRISAPVQFVKASQVVYEPFTARGERVNDAITQTSPTEATISFPHELSPYGLVELGVNYNGEKYAFAFRVANGIEIDRTTFRGRMASVFLHAAVSGVLSVKIGRPEGGAPLVVANRRVTGVGNRIVVQRKRIVVHLRLRAVPGKHLAPPYRVVVTLKNAYGAERFAALLSGS